MKNDECSLMNARPRGMSIMIGNQARMFPFSLNHGLLLRTAIAYVGLASLAGSLYAAEPSVTAVLSSSEAIVGQGVQLQIQVRGDRNVAPPSEISVDGLEIESTGQMQSFDMRGFDVTSSVTLTYTIVPERTGKFTIPPQTLRVGNTTLRTPALTLNVTNSG